MFNQKNVIGFSKEAGVLGAIGEVSYINGTVTLVAENEELHKVSLNSVVFLEEIGNLGENAVFNRDVLGTVDGKMYEVELQANGEDVTLFLLNDKLLRVEAGETFNKSKLAGLEPYVTLVGNIFELELELPVVDFNIKIVRDFNGEYFTYFYACNNKATGEIDLIKVVFIGVGLLEEEYERQTLSHEEYLDAIATGKLKEVTPQELQNYATGLRYGQKPQAIAQASITIHSNKLDVKEEFEEEEEEEETDDNYCEECGEHETDCNCLWEN